MRVLPILLFTAASVLAADPSPGIRAVLDRQAADWNRGDLQSFVAPYAADAVFVGREVTRGSAGVLERYRRAYPTRETMGTLQFEILDVSPRGNQHASVIGRFRLRRTAAGGGDSSGIFTLLLRREKAGWKIVLDHTS